MTWQRPPNLPLMEAGFEARPVRSQSSCIQLLCYTFPHTSPTAHRTIRARVMHRPRVLIVSEEEDVTFHKHPVGDVASVEWVLCIMCSKLLNSG